MTARMAAQMVDALRAQMISGNGSGSEREDDPVSFADKAFIKIVNKYFFKMKKYNKKSECSTPKSLAIFKSRVLIRTKKDLQMKNSKGKKYL